jgi:TPP-dependent indolepyruvate ferredoxin oxidoreductase alpha subunit
MPEGGLNARLSSIPLGQQARNQEALMQDYKIYAALAYARENKLNHTTIDSPDAKLGIIASGKSYLDVLEALEELGIDEAMAAKVGLRLFKVAMPGRWSRTACANSRKAWTRSWWWKKSASSSNTSSRNSCTTGATTCVRA